jgi:hypothetical protein
MAESTGHGEAPFAKDTEVIGKFNLTNNELMRYRLNGELPDRAKPVLEQTYKDQTSPPARKIAETTEEKPNLEDYSQYKQWAVDLLSKVDTSLDLKDTQEDELKQTLEQLTNSMYDFDKNSTKHFNTWYRDDEHKQTIKEASKKIAAKLQNLANSEKYPPAAKASVIDMHHHLEEVGKSADPDMRHSTENLIQQRLEQQDYDCVGILLKNQHGVENDAFRMLRKGIRPDQLPDSTAISLLDPLMSLMETKVKQSGLEFLHVIDLPPYIDRVIRYHKKGLEKAVQSGYDVVSVRSHYVNALLQRFDEIRW